MIHPTPMRRDFNQIKAEIEEVAKLTEGELTSNEKQAIEKILLKNVMALQQINLIKPTAYKNAEFERQRTNNPWLTDYYELGSDGDWIRKVKVTT